MTAGNHMKAPEDLPQFDLERFLPYRVTVAAQRLSEGLARQYRDRFGISIPEWRVLAHLAHSGNVSVRDIEARVAMERSKVSRAASRLEASGYVEKRINDADRRLLQLTLTARGRRLMAELLPIALAYQEELVNELGRHRAGFVAGLEKLGGGGRQ